MHLQAKQLYTLFSQRAKSILGSVVLCIGIIVLSVACAGQRNVGQLYAISQTAGVDGWRVTVHSFCTLPPDQWHQPAEGHVFCAVELTLENSSGKIRYIMPEKQMILLDSDGRRYAPHHTAAVVTARQRQWIAPEGEMSIGERAHGAVSYQIPRDARGLRWLFRSGLFPWSASVTFVLGEVPQQ